MATTFHGHAASKKRLLVSFLLDALVFSVLFAPIARGLAGLGLGGVARAALGVVLLVFLSVYVRAGHRGTPGTWALGIEWDRGAWRVDPRVARGEAWWTILIAFLGALDATKSLVRWTSGLPPPPFFGLPLDAMALGVIVTVSGAIRLVTSAYVLRCSPWAAFVGAVLPWIDLASALVAGPAFRAWIVERANAQAAERGELASPERIAALSLYLPLGIGIAAVVGSIWLVAAGLRFRVNAGERRP